jgi:capsule assembly protein Wzi
MPYWRPPGEARRAPFERAMSKAGPIVAAGMLLAFASAAGARGVSPYLPLDLEPEIESQIERVLILAGKPIMRRPIAAATVLDALPKACQIDRLLCQQVSRYLSRYTHTSDLTHASIEGAATHGADTALPDRYGLHNRSDWAASASLYWQPSDYLLLSAGADAYDGRVDYTGSMLSIGFSKAQLDIGYKPHWFSPLTDSSMLMSSEAPTMPSVSLSNYEPLTRLGFSYELFEARMSKQDNIVYTPAPGGFTSGYPRLGGLQLAIEPVSGWSLALNRLVQFGGGERGGSSPGALLRAFYNPSKAQEGDQASDPNAVNQEASVTSSVLFPGRVPFAIYAEYAGEDTSRGRNILLGNTDLSWGIHFPRLGERFDLTLEASEWQDLWYTHTIWLDGMTNYGLVIGNWVGDQRVFGNGVGGRSAMARLNWDASFGGQLQLRYRTLTNENYAATGFPPMNYQRFQEVSLGYARPWNGVIVGGEFDTGSDVFGKSFGRLAGFVRYDDPKGHANEALLEGPYAEEGGSTSTSVFVSAGLNALRVRTDLTELTPKSTGPFNTGGHFALGARRAVSEHNDLGARVEYDDLDGKSLLGVRLIDYRYRFSGPLAIAGFLGAARYALATPAYGFYYGAGVEWRDLLPHLDLGVEARYYDSVARDHVLPSDPNTARIDSFYDIWGGVASLTYHF